MLALEPAPFDGYSNAREVGLPAGNRFLDDSPLNRALGASGGGRRRRRRTARKHRRTMTKGGLSQSFLTPIAGGRRRKTHRKSRRGHRRAARK